MGDPRSDLHDLRALAHPLRMRILGLLADTAMSAAEVARELGGTQANISYHLRRLLDVGLLEMAEEVPIRGGLAKRYRQRPGAVAAAGGDDQALFAELSRRTAHRGQPSYGATADAELWVDPDLWRDTVDRARDLVDRLRAAARPPHAPGTVRVSTTISLFEMDPS